MAGTDKARERTMAVAQQQANAPEQAGQPTVMQLLETLKPQIARALPKKLTAERFTRIVLTTVRTTPALLRCKPESLMAAVMLSAQLGLEPGPLGHAYFVPYGQEVTFIVGYKGMIHLARNSGELLSIEAREVCEADEFEYEYGLNPKLRHIPAEGDRGQLTHVYGVAHFKDGGHYFEVLPVSEVERYRQRSATGKGNSPKGPWASDYVAMARKTAIRRMAPYLPLSPEAAQAVEADEGIVVGSLDHVEVTHPDGQVVDVQVNGSNDEPAAADGQQSLDACPVCGSTDDAKHDEKAHQEFDAREAQA